jgi:hypothetical protein
VTRSWGWNIMRTSKVAMSITRLNWVWWYRWSDLGHCITETRGIEHRCLRFNDKRFPLMHKGHYGHWGPTDDHSTERCLGDVWSVLEPCGNTLKGSMMI